MRTKGETWQRTAIKLCALLEFNVPGSRGVRYLAPGSGQLNSIVLGAFFRQSHGARHSVYFAVATQAVVGCADTIYENFASVQELPAFHVMYHGEAIRDIYVYRCKKLQSLFPSEIGAEISFLPRAMIWWQEKTFTGTSPDLPDCSEPVRLRGCDVFSVIRPIDVATFNPRLTSAPVTPRFTSAPSAPRLTSAPVIPCSHPPVQLTIDIRPVTPRLTQSG